MWCNCEVKIFYIGNQRFFIYFNIGFKKEYGGKKDMQTCANLNNFHTTLHLSKQDFKKCIIYWNPIYSKKKKEGLN